MVSRAHDAGTSQGEMRSENFSRHFRDAFV